MDGVQTVDGRHGGQQPGLHTAVRLGLLVQRHWPAGLPGPGGAGCSSAGSGLSGAAAACGREQRSESRRGLFRDWRMANTNYFGAYDKRGD